MITHIQSTPLRLCLIWYKGGSGLKRRYLMGRGLAIERIDRCIQKLSRDSIQGISKNFIMFALRTKGGKLISWRLNKLEANIRRLEMHMLEVLKLVAAKRYVTKSIYLTFHQKEGSVFILFTMDSFSLFSTDRYVLRSEFKPMFWSRGSIDSRFSNLCAI